MSNDTLVAVPNDPGPAITPTPPSIAAPAARRRARTLVDSLAAFFISLGGIGIILSILAILLFLVKEVAPLFFLATGKQTGQFTAFPLDASHQAAVVGLEEQQEIGYTVSPTRIAFFSLPSGRVVHEQPIAVSPASTMTAIARSSGKEDRLGLGTEDGRVVPLAIDFTSAYESGQRVISPSASVGSPFQIDPTGKAIRRLVYQFSDAGTGAVALTETGRVWYVRNSGGSPVDLTANVSSTVTALVLDTRNETLSVGTADGRLFHFDVREASRPVLTGTSSIAPAGVAITSLAYLIGDRSLVVGTAAGEVSVWMPVRVSAESDRTHLRLIHRLASHPAAVTAISPSQRDKGFLTGDSSGNLYMHYSTSERTLLRFPGGDAIQAAWFAPKANGAIVLDRSGQVRTYSIQNPHPEITFATLFQPVWYEGYDKPEQVWQSSSGGDDFEPKFGLTPLIFGTLKGTMYALLLAVPLAVLAAVYTSMFMHPDLRAWIKPIIEIMAALPTVVLGFLAGLWMAPLLQRIFPAVLVMMVVVPAAVIAAAVLWQLVPRSMRVNLHAGVEALVLVPVLIAAVAVCLSLNGQIESLLFGSNYKGWLADVFGVRYDQRNALVVGFTMGFAIIPIIFSVSEEALSNVPRNLIAGSLALGATNWQTLSRLVFVSASPGIFSALMIGFGRAVGETMIVLMATGNTPIMDWSMFDGFRTLSANIAVEIPEAPHGGTLYRILFLAALLLFAMTFLLNTVAEVIRQRLRNKYSQF